MKKETNNMSKQTKQVINLLATTNKPEYNLSKLAEELFELGEVIMKTINKSQANRPPIEKLIEEAGDVQLRIKVIADQYNIKKQLKERVNTKCEELNEYYEKKQYVGGI